MGNICFVDKKKCDTECVLYRKGLRYKDDGSKPIPFEECAFNIMADCLENLIGRTIGMQKETNKVANILQLAIESRRQLYGPES